MGTNPSITYFEHFSRGNDLSASGRRLLWHYYRNLFKKFLPQDKKSRILDFGCGVGTLLEWLASQGYTGAEGVDTDSGQISFAKGLGVKAELASNSMEWLRAAGQFEMVFLTDVLEHVPRGEDLTLLCGLYDALKPGGTLVVKVPNASGSFASRLRYMDPTHYRSYTEHSLQYDLERCGFEQIRMCGDDLWRPRHFSEALAVPLRFVFRSVRRLEAMAEYGLTARHMILSLDIVAVARKSTLFSAL